MPHERNNDEMQRQFKPVIEELITRFKRIEEDFEDLNDVLNEFISKKISAISNETISTRSSATPVHLTNAQIAAERRKAKQPIQWVDNSKNTKREHHTKGTVRIDPKYKFDDENRAGDIINAFENSLSTKPLVTEVNLGKPHYSIDFLSRKLRHMKQDLRDLNSAIARIIRKTKFDDEEPSQSKPKKPSKS